MRCRKCEYENKPEAQFCVRCGVSLVKRCPACANEVEETDIFCPACGARCDGKQVCPKCGTVTEGDQAFCAMCGAILTKTAPQPTASAYTARPSRRHATMRSGEAALFGTITEWARAGLITALAVVIFVLSFFSAFKTDTLTDVMDDLGLELSRDIRISTLDIIGGAFATVDPKTVAEIDKDFEKFMRKHPDYRKLENAKDQYTASEIVTGMIEDYNVLKLAAIKETLDQAPDYKLSIWIMAAVSLGVIVCAGVLLALSVLSLVYLITGRRKKYSTVGMAVTTAFVAVGLGALGKLYGVGSMSGGMITILILGLCIAAVSLVASILRKEVHFGRENILSGISMAVSVCLTVVVLCLALSSVVKIEFFVENDLVCRYNSANLAEAWSAFAMAEAETLEYGGAAEYFEALVDNLTILDNDTFAQSALSPALMGVLGTKAYEVGMAVLGVLASLVSVALVALTVGMLAHSTHKAVKGDTSPARFGLPVAVFVLSAALLALSIAFVSLTNSTLDELRYNYTAFIAAGPIVLTVFAGVNMIQSIVFSRLSYVRRASAKPIAAWPEA